jgi:hypothetical protein
MEGHCLTGKSPQLAVGPMEKEEFISEQTAACATYTIN